MYMPFTTTTSTAITAVKCNPIDRTLSITFTTGGKVYCYQNVEPGVFLKLRRAHLRGESVGKAYNRLVRPMRYKFVKML